MLRLFVLVATVFFFTVGVLADGNFSGSCRNVGVSGTTLNAECKNSKKVYVKTSINLNKCLANYSGKLACAANFK